MECTEDLVHHRVKSLLLALFSALWLMPAAHAQDTQPLVAIHDSELTRALETIPATAPTPNGAGTTGFEWWARDWHYFLMPESVMEALRSDGTAFTTVGDANIAAGLLLTNGAPKYPIVISLASEAIRNDEIAPLTNYVAAGGFLLIGSSAFTRNPDGTTRANFWRTISTRAPLPCRCTSTRISRASSAAREAGSLPRLWRTPTGT